MQPESCNAGIIANSAQMAVIIRLDRIIHVFPLDCPIKSGNDEYET
jgi:hypothetical protein